MGDKRVINISKGTESWDTKFMTIPGWKPEKIRAAKVLVVGAGALGNEVIKNLTLLNVGHIAVVDFDVVEYGNLAKSVLFRKEDKGLKKADAAVKRLKEINDQVKAISIVGDIATDVGLGVFRRMDVVVGCLDNRLARMHINRHCFKANKSWVDGALENLAGSFIVYSPGISCYECSLTDDARRLIQYRMGCPDIAKRNASMGVIATTPIASSIIGGFQTQEALKIIFGDLESTSAGERFQYDGMKNFYLQFKEIKPRPECDSHVTYDDIIEAPEISHEHTVEQVLNRIEMRFDTSDVKILTNEDIALEVATSVSDRRCKTAIYKNHLSESEDLADLELDAEDEIYITESTSSIDRDFPYQDRTLKEIGIPFLEVLRVETKDDIYLVELTGDEEKLNFE
jgi:adenylyltransferase/sulfurtransferase